MNTQEQHGIWVAIRYRPHQVASGRKIAEAIIPLIVHAEESAGRDEALAAAFDFAMPEIRLKAS